MRKGLARVVGGGLLSAALLLAACSHPTIRVSQVRTLHWQPAGRPTPVEVPYLLYLPPGYNDATRSQERWPLFVYLRGWPLMGMKMGDIANGGLPGEIEEGREFPFVMVAPQAPSLLQGFEPERVHALIDQVERDLRIDPERIYLTGLSRGARDAWAAAAARPDRFAALVLCCGFGSGENARRCASIPAWGFHGGLDFLIPVLLGEGPMAAHRAAGGRNRWTVLTTQTHFVWHDVYARSDLYEWVLSQRKPGRDAATPLAATPAAPSSAALVPAGATASEGALPGPLVR